MKQIKSESSDQTTISVISKQWCVEFTPRLLHHDNDPKEIILSQPSITWYKSADWKIGIRTVYES